MRCWHDERSTHKSFQDGCRFSNATHFRSNINLISHKITVFSTELFISFEQEPKTRRITINNC